MKRVKGVTDVSPVLSLGKLKNGRERGLWRKMMSLIGT